MILCRFRSIAINHSTYLNNPHFTLRFFSSSRHAQSNLATPTADHLLHKHQFSPEIASKVSLALPRLKDPEKADDILSFFKESGFSKTLLEQVVERKPRVLCSELESSIKPKIKVLQDFGFLPTEVAEFISAYPAFLNPAPDANRLKGLLLVFREVFGSDLNASHLYKYRMFLNRNFGKTMQANITFLKSCGINSSLVKSTLIGMYLLFLKPETLKQVAKRVDEMGVDRESKMFFHALRSVSSMSAKSWEQKLDLFRRLGFSEDEILSMFRRVPYVFSTSERKIKEMTEVLLGSGLYDLSFIARQPQILIYSVERTIKPRLQVLKILKRKNLLNAKASIFAYQISEKKFIDSYVLTFADSASELLGMVNEARNQFNVLEGSVKARIDSC